MFTANDYKVAKRAYDNLVSTLPSRLKKLSMEGVKTVTIIAVNDNVDAVIAAFEFLESTDADFARSYDIDPKRGIIYLDYDIVAHAERIDLILRSSKFHLLGAEFNIVSEWDQDILDIRGFVLMPDKDGKLTIQLKPEPEYT